MKTHAEPAQPLISVIIPAYNSAAFISETLSSVTSQSYRELEILVIDDGSSDDTAARVLACGDERVHLIRQRNAGISLTRNAGLRAARGEFIALLDHDDYWHPQKIEQQLRCLQTAGDRVGICYSAFTRWSAGEPAEYLRHPLTSTHLDLDFSGDIYHLLLATNWVLLSTALIRRRVFDEIGVFDPELPPADDWDFVLRASRSFEFVKLDAVTTLYRVHPGQASRMPQARDIQTDLRDSYVLRYGTASRSGQQMSAQDLHRRRLYSRRSYISSLLSSKQFRTACQRALRLVVDYPTYRDSWAMLAVALYKLMRR